MKGNWRGVQSKDIRRRRLTMRLRTTFLFSIFMLMAAIGEARAEKRVALVIGNSAYQNAAELQNPRNDAEDVATTLRRLGFEVIAGLDLDDRGMTQKVRDFARLLDGA